MTTYGEFLAAGTQQLNLAGVRTARLDVFLLMEFVLGVERAQLLAHPEMAIPCDAENVLRDLLAQRARHVPVAQLVGKAEFYGREFVVSGAVLQPRPESETMIALLKKLVTDESFLAARATLLPEDTEGDETLQIADIGTGTGALGITAALELPNASIELLEIDEAAIEIAKVNVIKFTAATPVIKSDLLSNAPHNYDIILANLPYVPDDYPINEAARHEPAIALFAGSDGLDLYRRLFEQLQSRQQRPLLLLSEAFPTQHDELRNLAAEIGYQEHSRDGFIQVFIYKKT